VAFYGVYGILPRPLSRSGRLGRNQATRGGKKQIDLLRKESVRVSQWYRTDVYQCTIMAHGIYKVVTKINSW